MDWLRLYAEFATDPKVQMMSECLQRRLIMLFCLECGNGIETFHVTERETSIAFALRVTPEEIAATKAEFMRRGFVNEDWTLRNWGKRQYASDSSTERVRKHREAKKLDATEPCNKVKRFSNGSDTEQNRTEEELSTTSVVEVGIFDPDKLPPADEGKSEGSKDADQAATPCPVVKIVELYHAALPLLPKVEKITKTRSGFIRSRWREDLPSLDAWKNYFADVSASRFLTGRADAKPGHPPFIADLEWLCRPSNFAKVAEGKYHR